MVPWVRRLSVQPTVTVRADLAPQQLLDMLAEHAYASGWQTCREGTSLVIARGMRGGAFLSEVVQLPLLVFLQRVELVVDAGQEDGGAGGCVRVTCRVGAGELEVRRRVSTLLSGYVDKLIAAGAGPVVGHWRARP